MTDTAGTALVCGRLGLWMQTRSGAQFFPLDPRPGDVALEDIAHSLSCQVRFLGHTSEPYSVAQHSVHVASIVERTHPSLALHALLHDAAEAFTGDIPRPLKLMLSADGVPISEVEGRIQSAILAAFGLPQLVCEESSRVIKHADNVALATEARDLMGNPSWPGLPEPDAERIVPLEWWSAKRAFLAMFRRLSAARGDV